jgi:senataxin
MSRRVYNLWHLMTTSLAVIFKRTQDWAPLYDNETMVDWMRDALIFGRNLTEHIRAFEAAALGVSSGSSRFVDNGESPAKPTKTGTKLVQKLENVLRDLVSWMRLTESVTLSILLAEYFADLVPQC